MDPHRRHHHHNPPTFEPRYPHQHSSYPLVRFSSSPNHHPHPHLLPPSSFPSPPPPHHHRPRVVDLLHHHHVEDDRRAVPPYVPPAYPQPQPHPHPHPHPHPRDLLLYVPANQKTPSSPRVSSDLIIYPDPHPRRIPRDLPLLHQDNDEADRVRVRPAAFDRVPMPHARIELVARKRQRREIHDYGYPDEVLEEEEDDDGSAAARVQRKPVFWGGLRVARGDPPLEPDPPELIASSPCLPPDRYREDPFADEQEMIMMMEREREMERGYVPEVFQVDDRHECRERQFLGRGKSVAFGTGSSSQDVVVTPRKRSVWQRLEESNAVPYLPCSNGNHNGNYPVHSDSERADTPMDLDVSFRSNAFVAKEVSMSPLRDALNIDRRNAISMERNPRKEPMKGSSDSSKSGVKAAADRVPAKVCIGTLVASEKDTPLVSPEKKLKLVMDSPRISTSKPGGDGEKLANESAGKLASKSLERGKLLKHSSGVITSETAVPAPEGASSPVGKVVTSTTLGKISEEIPSDQRLTSSTQTLPSEPKNKVTEKVLGSPSVDTKKLVKKVNAVGTPKKRVVIRKRLVPRGTSATKPSGKASTAGTFATEVAKTVTSVGPDREASEVKVSGKEVKMEISISCTSSMPNANEKVSSQESSMKELSAESKIAKKMPSENMQHIPTLCSASHGHDITLNSAEKASQEALVSPSKNNKKKDGNLMVEGKEIPGGVLALQGDTKQQQGGNVTIAGKPTIANKLVSQDINMCSFVATKPVIVTREGVQSSSNDAMLAVTLMNKVVEENTPSGNSLPLVRASGETVKESSISQDSSLCPDGKVSNVLGTENKRKREDLTSSCPNILPLPVPNLTNQSLNVTASVIPTKDSVHSEGAHIAPSKKKKRKKKKKKKVSSPNIKASPSVSQTEEICKIDAPGSFQKDLVHSGERSEASKSDPCTYQHHLEEAWHLRLPAGPGKDINLSGAQDLSKLSNLHLDLDMCMPSKTPITKFGSAYSTDITSHLALHHEMLQKSSQKITAEFSGQKKHAISASKEDEGYGHVDNCGIKDLYHGNNTRGQIDPGSQLPMCGHQPVSGETVGPCCAGHKDAAKNEVVQEQALLVVAPHMEVASDGAKSNQVSSLLSSNVAFEAAVLHKTAGGVVRKRDREGGENDMEGVGIEEKRHKICLQQSGEQSGSIEYRTTKQGGLKVQERLNVVPLKAQGSIPSHTPTTAADGKTGDSRMLVENRLLVSESSSREVDQPSIHKPLDQDRNEPNSTFTKQKNDVQIEEVENVTDVGHPVGNSGNDSIEKSPSNSKKSTLEPSIGTDLDKTPVCVDPDKNTPSLSLKVKTQLIGSSQIVAMEETGSAKDGQDRAKSRIFPQHTSLPARHPARIALGLNGRHRTWRRTNPSSVPQSPAHLKIPMTNSLQRQTAKRPENTQGSYVRKGNSLIRRSNEVTPPPQPLPVPGNSSKTTNEISYGRSLDTTMSVSDGADYLKSGKFCSAERPRTPPLPQSSKQSGSTTNLVSCQDQVPTDPPGAGLEVQANLFKAPNLELSIPKCSSASSIEQLKANDLKRMVYVKHKSNQLVATKGSDTSNSSLFPITKTQTTPLSSDLYYMRKNNKLIRGTSSDNLTKHDALCSVSTSNVKNHSGELPSKKVARKGKNFKRSKFSLVWRLNSVHPHGKDVTLPAQHEVLPYIFPWKRATYRRTSLINTSKNHSLKLISKKLQIFRKRNTVYTISKGGFVLRKSGIRSIGARSLKWSKSIEKHTKKANEEATLAVAEVQRVQREGKGIAHACASSRGKKCISKERIFRVGNVRYKMDSSKRTLVRIPDDDSSNNLELGGQNSLKSIIPRRLIIDHDEYIRVGNGNQLVRDPKRLVRILASEKVRWSLHTARLRLAKKQQYCQFFTRYGKCNKEGKRCPYIHDPTKVAICTKFLKGLCSGTNCRLTHKVIPERMPDCSYFLRGHCTNASCPYRHVKVNPRASVCEGFLRGYCKDGDECQKKHSYVCPDFEATGKCFQGSDCKLHHPKPKSKSKKRKTTDVKVHSKGRYFGSGMAVTGQPQILGAGKSTDDASMEGIFSEGRMVDYISLDVGFEEKSMEKNDEMDLLPHELDSDLSEALAYDLDALIKPIHIMNRKEHDITDAATVGTD